MASSPRPKKTAIKATSGRKPLNIQGALDLETFQFTFVEGEKINAQTTRQMLEKLEAKNPASGLNHLNSGIESAELYAGVLAGESPIGGGPFCVSFGLPFRNLTG